MQAFGEVFGNGLKLHHDINHVENNLLARYKCGDLLRELFQKAVNCYTIAEKAQHISSRGERNPNNKFRGRCSRCKQHGHYSGTCRNPAVEEELVPPGRNWLARAAEQRGDIVIAEI